MKKNMLSRVLTLALAALLALSLFACGKKSDDNSTGSSGSASYQVGICSYADDASLNQIVDNIESRLKAIGQEKGVTFEISYDNCNTDSAVLNQIIANFMADKVDLMIGVATPVAVAMQAATEGTDIPVVFAAVSDPVGAGLVESLEAPGANITGTSDYLDTDAILDLIFAADPDAKSIALLYDLGQDSSAAPIKNAKAYLDKRGVSYGHPCSACGSGRQILPEHSLISIRNGVLTGGAYCPAVSTAQAPGLDKKTTCKSSPTEVFLWGCLDSQNPAWPKVSVRL